MSHGGPFISLKASLQWTMIQFRRSEIKSLPTFSPGPSNCLHFVVFSISTPDLEGDFILPPEFGTLESRKKSGIEAGLPYSVTVLVGGSWTISWDQI